jgi:thiol:disulfide interchange protein
MKAEKAYWVFILFAVAMVGVGYLVGNDVPEVATHEMPAAVAPQADGVPSSELPHGRIDFVNGYEQGVQQARAAGKPMLVFFTAEWCHFCKQMAADAFVESSVVDLSERFTCVLVDADAEPQVCRKYGVELYPTVQFISSRGVPLNRIKGKKPSYEVMQEMYAALDAIARLEVAQKPVDRK